ncbi:hypothetical protein SMJ63A_130113 [Stenotrophomonas geniculata]
MAFVMVGCTLGEESIAGTVPAAPMRQAVSCRGRAFDGGERTHAQYTDAVFLERRCTVPPCTPGPGGQGCDLRLRSGRSTESA